ncbi:hypothetical protein EV360DRAFT_77085 [Lentinula raphanica]|nr:hypothetical protein EV360DRAFT_77085 [Lentinula raphanica]
MGYPNHWDTQPGHPMLVVPMAKYPLGVIHGMVLFILSCVLAAEILDHIIDQLEYDKQTLLAVSMSSKRLLTRSRFNLFHTVYVDNHRPGCEEDSLKSQRASAFFRILDAPYSSMGYAIHHLVIEFEIPPLFPGDISRIQRNLPNLRILHWHDTMCDIPDAFKSLVFGSNIEAFIVSEVKFRYTAEFIQIITMLPATLKIIDVGRVAFNYDNSDTETVNNTLVNNPLAKRKRIHLHTLRSVSTASAHTLFHSLISLNIITIDRFIIEVGANGFYTAKVIPWLNEMLLKYGSMFSEVLYKLPEVGNLEHPAGLQYCANLRVLHIRSIFLGFSMENSQGPTDVTTDTIEQVIYSVPNPKVLEEIKIRFLVELAELDETASPHWLSIVPTDHVTFIVNQLAHFDWTKFSEFLLNIPFPPGRNTSILSNSGPHVETVSYPSPPLRGTSFSVSRPGQSLRRRLHIQIGVAEFAEDDAARELFAEAHEQYVQYIYNNGMKDLVEKGGLDELLISQDYFDLDDFLAVE